VANNLLMAANAIDSIAASTENEYLTTAELQATAIPTPLGTGFPTAAVDLSYEWISGALQGTSVIKLGLTTLVIGNKFTQADIDAGSPSGVNWTADSSAQDDDLVFRVTDLEHGGVIQITLNFVST